jgi:membrane-bound lytic murein transglycosylase B
MTAQLSLANIQRSLTAWAAACAVGLAAVLAAPQAQGQTAPKTKPVAQTKTKVKNKTKAKARPTAAAPGPSYADNEAMRGFAQDLADRSALPLPWVLATLSQARRVQTVRDLVMPPPAGTAKNWAAYRARFVEPQRINAGLAFWRGNQSTLARAQAQYGVPAEVVVAIVGVETFYGRITGNFRVIDALATLAFDFPTGRKDRTPFFRQELEAFLLLCQREGLDPLAVKGSFAGAMGLPQFMPSSVNKYAVDFDGDGHVHLHSSTADVIGSVANYFAQFGWQAGMPSHYAVAAPVDTTARATLLAPDIVPSFTAQQMADQGAVLDEAGRSHTGPLALVELQNGSAAPSFVAGTQNFYVVTRYNWSSYYAMAVLDLAQALKDARQR